MIKVEGNEKKGRVQKPRMGRGNGMKSVWGETAFEKTEAHGSKNGKVKGAHLGKFTSHHVATGGSIKNKTNGGEGKREGCHKPVPLSGEN